MGDMTCPNCDERGILMEEFQPGATGWLKCSKCGGSGLNPDLRDIIDPYVAETLYEEHVVRNIEYRGGMASESDWDAWEDLPDMSKEYWMGLAVAARLASKAAFLAHVEGKP